MSAQKPPKWKSIEQIVLELSQDRAACKAAVLELTQREKLIPTINSDGGKFKVSVDGFELESFNSLVAAKFYCKRICP